MKTNLILTMLALLGGALMAATGTQAADGAPELAPLTLIISESGERMAHEGHLDLAMTALTPDGAPLKDALVHARLWHVNEFGFFTTDIPYVEGEAVFDVQTTAKNGTLHVMANTPIPGKYVLDVRAIAADGSYEPIDASRTFDVPQIPDKSIKGGLLLLFFSLAGFAGGYYFLGGRGD